MEKAAGHSRSAAPRQVRKSIVYECTSPRSLQTCTSEPRARIKNAVPSKEQKTCGCADTDMSERARALSRETLRDEGNDHHSNNPDLAARLLGRVQLLKRSNKNGNVA